MEPHITWLGHASFRIEGEGMVIYVDPWKLKSAKEADLILITHSHHDHLSEDDISKVRGRRTAIIGSTDVASKLPGAIPMRPGDEREVMGVKVEAHRAYNPKKQFHPKENDWVGFVVDIGGYRIYHSGDTDVIPEMKGLKDIDVALVPVGGTYTMNAEEAAEAVKLIGPKKAMPMHWGDIVGSRKDAKKFQRLADCEVEIPEKER